MDVRVFRKCQASEIGKVGAFYDRVVEYLDGHVNYPKWTYREYPTEASVREMTEADCQFICLEGDQLVGAFVLNTDPQGAYEKAGWSRKLALGEYLVCHTLAVDPDRAGEGIGGSIVAYCLDYAGRHGYKAIRLDVVPDNLPARRLYEKCGFVYVGDVDLERGLEEIPLFSLYEKEIET